MVKKYTDSEKESVVDRMARYVFTNKKANENQYIITERTKILHNKSIASIYKEYKSRIEKQSLDKWNMRQPKAIEKKHKCYLEKMKRKE